jgi:hypothetical protein
VVLEQAKKNGKASSTIDFLVIDRGFFDGKDLDKIDKDGLELVIHLKRDMLENFIEHHSSLFHPYIGISAADFIA